MPVPSYRVPVRVARGTLTALTAGISDLQEGELCYATDIDVLYIIEGGVLTATVTDVLVVGDTSPQLGGNLDTNGFEIVTVSAANLKLAPNTTGVVEIKGNTGNDAAIQLNCETNSHGVKIKSPPHSAAATYTLVLPDDTGTSGQALTTNGSGVLTWATPSTVGSIGDLSDVDTTTNPPTDGQVLTWVNADSEWQPLNSSGGFTDPLTTNGDVIIRSGGSTTRLGIGNESQVLTVSSGLPIWANATGGGGGGGGSTIARLTENKTASSGAATFSGIGTSGIIAKITSSLDAWIVLYGSAAERTSDASRTYATDPSTGSGVLAEFYITAGTTLTATPGTSYFNNDTSATEAIYAAVRSQAGANVNSQVTITAYGNQAITSVSGGTFGSGV
tara:strand:+ start:7392 stop:8558 length:1167 start_codon:yes stop_codon:yes gene_type:complete